MDILTMYATHENRWVALIVIALGLAIIIIDNTVLNVSIPYMLRDLNISFDVIQWAISGYSLTIAAILITVGRLGDLFGYKRMFLSGIVIFVLGSFIASEATGAVSLLIGRAVVQAVGAAITLTSALSLLAYEFEGRERAIAFGIWGSVAGASATIGPLLGGYLTTYFSWRWSLRINLIVGLIAILGSIFIMESKRQKEKRFDWVGTVLSSAGLFLLVFVFIEGRALGWIRPSSGYWPLGVSVIPLIFVVSLALLYWFVRHELRLEKKHGNPLMKMSMFKNRGFTIGLLVLGLLALGQFGTFLTLPIYLENVLSLSALEVGIALLSISVSLFVFGSVSGFLASRFDLKWIIVSGLGLLLVGVALLIPSITTAASIASLSPALVIFGIGFGLAISQLNNVIISSAPREAVGEASATSITVRQVGFAVGIALIGAVLAGTLSLQLMQNISTDERISPDMKGDVMQALSQVDVESGNLNLAQLGIREDIISFVKADVDEALVAASKNAIFINLVGTLLAFILAFFLPSMKGDKSAPAAEG